MKTFQRRGGQCMVDAIPASLGIQAAADLK